MSETTPNYIDEFGQYFIEITNSCHKQYEALRAFFYEDIPAKEVAKKFGYTINAFYSLIKDFKKGCANNIYCEQFFNIKKTGRKEKDVRGDVKSLIIALRKQYLSVPDIKVVLDSQNYNISTGYIFSIIKNEGFGRLPRRDLKSRVESQKGIKDKIPAAKSKMLSLLPEYFSSQNIGLLCFIPYIKEYKLDEIIKDSTYPETKEINKISSILSFLALKLSNIRRYCADDLWCMDRGIGLFAGLNVLPKTAWFSSYSSRVTREMNLNFLKKLQNIWKEYGLLSDTTNLDFTTIPYWGEESHLENNWSGKRHKALTSMLTVLAQDPDSGIINYGDTGVRHKNQADVVLEFLDFYKKGTNDDIKYLVFDSKFTVQENLRKLEDNNVKFLTIRRRGKNIVNKLDEVPLEEWKRIRVADGDGKSRSLLVYEEITTLRGYGKKIRQINIKGHGKIKPALLITNDFDSKLTDVVRKYARRWIIEKGISEQIEFFHLNRVSSSMVIKVDFDLTMTILAHNLYRLMALNIDGYSNKTAITIYEKLLFNSGNIKITSDEIQISLKKKRSLPVMLSELQKFKGMRIPWLDNKKITFSGYSAS